MSELSVVVVDGVEYSLKDEEARQELTEKASIEQLNTKADKTNVGLVKTVISKNGWHCKVFNDNTFFGYRTFEYNTTIDRKIASKGMYTSTTQTYQGPYNATVGFLELDGVDYAFVFDAVQATCRTYGITMNVQNYLERTEIQGFLSANVAQDTHYYYTDIFAFGHLVAQD